MEEASLIRLIPVANGGASEICTIQRAFYDGDEEISFLFQRRRFIYNFETGTFNPPSFTIDSPQKISFYQQSVGLTGDLENLERQYGENKFDIPIPTFLELWKEHVVAPFCFPNVLCCSLVIG